MASVEALYIDDKITYDPSWATHCVAKGAAFKEMFLRASRQEEGFCRGIGRLHCTSPTRPTAISAPCHLLGGSMEDRNRARPLFRKRLGKFSDVTVCFFGDAPPRRGFLYEVMNMAALWKPSGDLTLRRNNGYSEYTRTTRCRPDRSPARAEAFGIESPHSSTEQDVLAFNKLATDWSPAPARAKARSSFRTD